MLYRLDSMSEQSLLAIKYILESTRVFLVCDCNITYSFNDHLYTNKELNENITIIKVFLIPIKILSNLDAQAHIGVVNDYLLVIVLVFLLVFA